MTREEIMALEGQGANIAAARHVLGWTLHDKVVVGNSPTMNTAWAFRHPLSGVFTIIPVQQTPDFFDKKNSYILVDAMLRRGYAVLIRKLASLQDGTEQWKGGFSSTETFAEDDCVTHTTAQDALLRAALIKTAQ
jgi:hypothetical protein